ncbi:MAG TPA: PspA/IM30 family protein, partial [Marinagarivorans sp.]
MNIWSKLVTALRGGVNEAGEAIVDSQALRILEQEIRDASTELQQSKDSLASIMARQKVSEEKCAQLRAKIAEHETYAIKALEQNNEELAKEVAQKIAELENRLANEAASSESYAGSASELRDAIQKADEDLAQLKHEVDTVKATESVQKAQASVSAKHSGTNTQLLTAAESLERIKEKQALKAAQMKVASELARDTSGAGLEAKLKDAGI